MSQLAGLFDVILRSAGAIGLATAVGGTAYTVLVLRERHPSRPLSRSLSLIAAGALVVAVAQTLLVVVVHPWALADDGGRWPVSGFLATGFGRASIVRIVLALGLVVAARALGRRPGSTPRWAFAVALCLGLMADAAWLAHAVSRLEGRAVLMAITSLHELGAVVWVGGIVHLVAFAHLWRRQSPRPAACSSISERGLDELATRVFTRFTGVASVAMVLVLGPGLALSWRYVGSMSALIGTAYGLMVLTKTVLLAAALGLGAISLVLSRRTSDPARLLARLPPLVEAEVGLGITVLMAAAALTSLPPAADVIADRASPGQVLSRFALHMPRLTSPPVSVLLAVAAPIDDPLAPRQPEEFAWSEYNHHAAGFFVLLMGLLAALHRTGRLDVARHWPLGFLGLAVFLFLRNDPRAWPLGPAGFWQSMRLPDVLQHRVVVLLLVGLALFEWSVRTGRLTGPRWPLAFPLLCAAGGATLLTHSHAMWNLRSEFLIEVSHVPLGVLAVLLGWGRWLELRLPAADRLIPGRIWCVSMVLIGVILLLYREA